MNDEPWEYIKTQPIALPQEITPQLALLVLHEKKAQVIPLAINARFVLGRGADAYIAIGDHALSRQHALIERIGEQVFVEDLNSLNGIFINGSRVTRAKILPGDDVVMGNVHVSLLNQANYIQGFQHHLQFVTTCSEEMQRSKSFGHSLAIILVRPANHQQFKHVTEWAHLVKQVVRPFDCVGVHNEQIIEILLPETGYASARRQADLIVRSGTPMLCGICFFPGNANDAEALIQMAYAALSQATIERPIVAERSSSTTPATSEEPAPYFDGLAMKDVLQSIERVASALMPVLIIGETGVGKEVIAQTIHQMGPRHKKSMKCLNCGLIAKDLTQSILFGHERGSFTGAVGLQKGIFEETNGGTLLLDEVGELSLEAQVALLRVLETGKITRLGSSHEISVDVRILSATHRNLEVMCEEERFRWDLYYRLNPVTIVIPPLRSRLDEIKPLVEYFLKRIAKLSGLSPKPVDESVYETLYQYSFPGNIRELRNIVERAMLVSRGNSIILDDLPTRIVRNVWENDHASSKITTSVHHLSSAEQEELQASFRDFREEIRNFEMIVIKNALERVQGNKTAAAKRLNMPLRTLMYKIQGFDPEYLETKNIEVNSPHEIEMGDFKQSIKAFEDKLILEALEHARGNKTEAARSLNLPVNTFLNKLKSAQG